nr:glycosyltransferase 87 family protein [Corynebacterium sp. TAE3-ERU12]
MDFQVYYFAGKAVITGQPVYDYSFFVSNFNTYWLLPFTYPPFAAAFMGVFAKMPVVAAAAVWQVASLLVFALVIAATLVRSKYRPGLAMAGFVVLILISSFGTAPVRSGFFWGQVNMIVMALVAVDFLRTERWSTIRSRGWVDDHLLAGVGVGIAAGIKVYPAFFGIVFLLQRRWRAAVVSGVTFFITVLIGALAVPNTWDYWVNTMSDTTRYGGLQNVTSQSINLILIREFGIESTALWAAAFIVVTLLAAATARLQLQRGQRVGALCVIGMAACLVSPFSWHHYYLWVVPLVIIAAVAVLRAAEQQVPTLALPLVGVVVPLIAAAALWPYVSIVMGAPFDIYAQTSADSPLVRSTWVGWTLLMLISAAVVEYAVRVGKPNAEPVVSEQSGVEPVSGTDDVHPGHYYPDETVSAPRPTHDVAEQPRPH